MKKVESLIDTTFEKHDGHSSKQLEQAYYKKNKYQQKSNVFLTPTKLWRIKLKKKLQNLEIEMRYIKKYFEVFDKTRTYKIVYINRSFLLEIVT